MQRSGRPVQGNERPWVKVLGNYGVDPGSVKINLFVLGLWCFCREKPYGWSPSGGYPESSRNAVFY